MRVGLQPEQAAHLSALAVNDPGSHEVGGVRIHALQQRHAEPQELQDSHRKRVRRLCSATDCPTDPQTSAGPHRLVSVTVMAWHDGG